MQVKIFKNIEEFALGLIKNVFSVCIFISYKKFPA